MRTYGEILTEKTIKNSQRHYGFYGLGLRIAEVEGRILLATTKPSSLPRWLVAPSNGYQVYSILKDTLFTCRRHKSR